MCTPRPFVLAPVFALVTGCGTASFSDAMAKAVVEQCLRRAPAEAPSSEDFAVDGHELHVSREERDGGWACEVKPSEGDRAYDHDRVAWRLAQTVPAASIEHLQFEHFDRGSGVGAAILFSPSVTFVARRAWGPLEAWGSASWSGTPNTFELFSRGGGRQAPEARVLAERAAPGAAMAFEAAKSHHKYGWMTVRSEYARAASARAALEAQANQSSGSSSSSSFAPSFSGHQTAPLPGEPGTDSAQFTPGGGSYGGSAPLWFNVEHKDSKSPEAAAPESPSPSQGSTVPSQPTIKPEPCKPPSGDLPSWMQERLRADPCAFSGVAK